jgi:hypothetical protein
MHSSHGGSSSVGRAPGRELGAREFEPPLSPQDLGWVAGILEGEGSFIKPPPSRSLSPVVSVVMTDLDVMEHLGLLLRTKVIPTRRHLEHPEWKPAYCIRLTHARAASLMHTLRPFMGERRRGQIDVALAARKAALVGRRTHYVLSPADRKAIAERFEAGERAIDLAEEFRVVREHVYKIVRQSRVA